MIKILLFISAFLFSIHARAQHNDIYLFPDYVIYQSDSLSRYDYYGLKQGDWIEFEIRNIVIAPVSDTCDFNGKIKDGIDFISATVYYSRTKKKSESNCDSVFSNVIPKSVIKHLSFGSYVDDLKEGIWKTFDNQNKLFKVFQYYHDKQFGEFQYYYPNDSLMISGNIDTLTHIMSFRRFSEDGILIEDKTTDIEKLYRILR